MPSRQARSPRQQKILAGSLHLSQIRGCKFLQNMAQRGRDFPDMTGFAKRRAAPVQIRPAAGTARRWLVFDMGLVDSGQE